MCSSFGTIRRGASEVVTVLLVLILAALVALLVVVLIGRPQPPNGNDVQPGRDINKTAAPSKDDSNVATGTKSEGEEANSPGRSRYRSSKNAPSAPGTATEKSEKTPPNKPEPPPPPPPPPPPKPVGDPQRIRDVLQEGKRYESILKVGLEAQVIDKDWGVRQTVNLVYVAESRVRRTVERNDGKTVVLLCHILESRITKLESDVEVRLDLGEPGFLVLGVLDQWLTGGAGTAVVVEVGAIAGEVLTQASKAALRGATAKAKAAADSLQGKKFRVMYRDGEGVVNLEPVNCTLNDEERSHLEGLAVLSDCYILPDLKSKPGQYWDVEARALADLLPPTWRGRPSGVVTIKRTEDYKKGDKDYAALEITAGTFRVDASDGSRRRLGEVTPRGRLDYNISDGYVDHAELSAQASLEEVSTDHLLFEARFQANPRMEIQYTCKRLEGPAAPSR